MGKSFAIDVYSHFESCTEILEAAKYLQVSLDSPNVNLAFLDILNEARSNADVGKKLLDLGTYGLHIMHNAFKHGKNASTSDINKLLSAMYKIFHESPSHQADYEKLTSALLADYPLKCCSH